MQALALASLMLAFLASGQAQTEGPRLDHAGDRRTQAGYARGQHAPRSEPPNDLGPVADDLHLDMYLQLKRSPQRDLAAQRFVESLTDKTSPNFHKWITAAEYGQRFGAAPEDIATVSRWLESHGFTVNNVPANQMVVDFSGNAGQVRAALHTLDPEAYLRGVLTRIAGHPISRIADLLPWNAGQAAKPEHLPA